MKNKLILLICSFLLIFNICLINISQASTDNSIIYIDAITNEYGANIVTCQYSNNNEIEKVIIREGITGIHDEAFGSCVKLTDVTIPRTVTAISQYAFWNCKNKIVIHGYEGTEAETFANKYGYEFENIQIQKDLLPTYIEQEVLLAEKRISELNKLADTSFSFITDIHADNDTYSPMANITAFNRLGNSGLLKFGICAGDITTGAYEDLKTGKALYNLEYFSNKLKNNKSVTLFARGNHDCNTRNDSSVAISSEAYYENVLKHLEGEVVFDSNNSYSNYYYKDLEDEKIRVCVLNAFNGENYEFIFGDAQLNFVANQVLDLSKKENPEEWQVIFLTHTVDVSKAHSEEPKDNEKLYSIINAFQEGKKKEIENIFVDYTNQGKGTVIAIITGHHHLDTTTIKNNILIITVRSSSVSLDRDNVSGEQYDSDDISFDVFSIDKENKMLYATKVGRGKDRKWSYKLDEQKENKIDEVYNDVSYLTDDYINVGAMLNQDNEVIAIVTSNSEFEVKSNQTWKLSKDKKTYIKILNDVSEEYTTTFYNVNGYSKTITFKLNDIKDVLAPSLQLSYIENDDGTITAKVTSNEILKNKTNLDWKLSKNRKEYLYQFYKNTENYVTAFSDMFGNSAKLTLNAKIFEPSIEYTENNNGTITAKATSKVPFANTKPTWNLSQDGKMYTKIYEQNQNYLTNFTDIYGNIVSKPIKIDTFNEEIDVEISYKDNGNGTVTAIAVSKNNKFAATKPTWNLSEDGYTYTKIYEINQDYTTTFVNVYGKSVDKPIKIDTFNEEIDVEISYKDNGNGTVTAIAVSKNNKFAATKPTWSLSEDGYTYTKIYEINQDYTTTFVNVYGKKTEIRIKINL